MTDHQPTLFEQRQRPSGEVDFMPVPAVLSLAESAAEWMDANPAAMGLFERFALEMAQHGRRFGMKALAERVRWEHRYEYPDDDWKLNNNYVAYIGRRLINEHPQLDALIERRKVQEGEETQ